MSDDILYSCLFVQNGVPVILEMSIRAGHYLVQYTYPKKFSYFSRLNRVSKEYFQDMMEFAITNPRFYTLPIL